MIYYLYQLLFPNGRSYVGISNNPRKRWAQHVRAARDGRNLPLHRAIRKYGWKLVQTSILATGSKEYILKLEIKTIKARDQNTYNISVGGESGMSGRHHSAEVRARIRASNIHTMASPEFRARRSIISRKMHTREMKDRKRTSVLITYKDPAVRARHSASLRAWHLRRQTVTRMFAFEQGA